MNLSENRKCSIFKCNWIRQLQCKRKNSTDSYQSVNSAEDEKPKGMRWFIILYIILGILFGIILLIFILVFVVLPIVFMNSIGLQRFFMFFNINDPPNPDFNDPAKYGVNNTHNFYITVKNHENDQLLSLGAWMVMPENANNFQFKTVNHTLQTIDYPVVLYLHGVLAIRAKPTMPLNTLRKHFLVVIVDYRDFGDSSPEPLSEMGVVNDTVEVYKWLRSTTNKDIYIWGHSLGGAISAHTIKKLKEENIVPFGLILESTFTTMREEISNNPIGRLFSWLAYFEATILDAVEKNGFYFNTATNILSVDCPIMIMHAEDDIVIPYTMGKRLYEIATEHRLPHQGNVTYHQFEALGYSHNDILKDPRIPEYINAFIAICKEFNAGQS